MIKSNIITPSVVTTTYPIIMKWKHGDIMVLFSSQREGTVIVNGDPFDFSRAVGVYKTDWLSQNFEPYYGKIKLSNQ